MTFAVLHFFVTVTMHHGHSLQLGIQLLPKLLQEAGFVEIQQLDSHFLVIGFVRATKPT